MKNLRNKLLLMVGILLFSTILPAQNTSYDVNGSGTLDILVIGTSQSINNSTEAFSPNLISSELQSILSADAAITMNVNVVAEDIYRVKNVTTGIANFWTQNLNHYCHSLMQYYFWPDGREDRINNLRGGFGTDWDYVIIGADPYIVEHIPSYYSLGMHKVAEKVLEGGAIPLLLMPWSKDDTKTSHFEEFVYRAANGAKVPLDVVPAGLAWNALPANLKDVSTSHPTPNGAYAAASSIYTHIFNQSAANSQYSYNNAIANVAQSEVKNAKTQTHYIGKITYSSPYKWCEVMDPALIYNHGGTSTENGILNGLQWVVNQSNRTLQFASSPPIHFNYGRSTMGSTHLYNVDSTLFDFSFGYPLHDDRSTGDTSMQYGLDQRVSVSDRETDLGVALHMVRSSEIPFARNVPLRTIISQMLEEIPGVMIHSDPWHMSMDANIAIGSYIYTMVTSDCAMSCVLEPDDPNTPEWRTFMAFKIGHETAWNLMYMEETSPCFKTTVDNQTSCDVVTWIDGQTYSAPTSGPQVKLKDFQGCDSTVVLHLTNRMDATVSKNNRTLMAEEEGASYQWLDCSDMSVLDNDTMQSFTAVNDGSYAVVIKKNGCVDTSNCVSVVNSGLAEMDGIEPAVYPNPNNGAFTIELGERLDEINVSITDLTGKELQLNRYQNVQLMNLMLEVPKGTYLLKINADGYQKVVKLVRE